MNANVLTMSCNPKKMAAVCLLVGLPAFVFANNPTETNRERIEPIISSAMITQQARQISGVVTDAKTGETIPGANILIKGSATGTSTDFDGNFSLEVPDGAILVVSYIGYLNQEVPASPNMTIHLREDSQALDEVVVVGYSTQSQESLTCALKTVKSE